MNIKEKKLNIFTEDSRFLIYRPVVQINEHDIGWYILRFMTLEQRNDILKHLTDDDIINITIEDNDEEIDVFIASTTIAEQETINYYAAENITEKCLFPTEKMFMMFELLNVLNIDS